MGIGVKGCVGCRIQIKLSGNTCFYFGCQLEASVPPFKLVLSKTVIFSMNAGQKNDQ